MEKALTTKSSSRFALWGATKNRRLSANYYDHRHIGSRQIILVTFLSVFISACSSLKPMTAKLDITGVNICGAPALKTILPFNADKSGFYYGVSVVCNKNQHDIKVQTVIWTGSLPKNSEYVGMIFIKERKSSPSGNQAFNIVFSKHAINIKANILILDQEHALAKQRVSVFQAYFNEQEHNKAIKKRLQKRRKNEP